MFKVFEWYLSSDVVPRGGKSFSTTSYKCSALKTESIITRGKFEKWDEITRQGYVRRIPDFELSSGISAAFKHPVLLRGRS